MKKLIITAAFAITLMALLVGCSNLTGPTSSTNPIDDPVNPIVPDVKFTGTITMPEIPAGYVVTKCEIGVAVMTGDGHAYEFSFLSGETKTFSGEIAKKLAGKYAIMGVIVRIVNIENPEDRKYIGVNPPDKVIDEVKTAPAVNQESFVVSIVY